LKIKALEITSQIQNELFMVQIYYQNRLDLFLKKHYVQIQIHSENFSKDIENCYSKKVPSSEILIKSAQEIEKLSEFAETAKIFFKSEKLNNQQINKRDINVQKTYLLKEKNLMFRQAHEIEFLQEKIQQITTFIVMKHKQQISLLKIYLKNRFNKYKAFITKQDHAEFDDFTLDLSNFNYENSQIKYKFY
jgi:ABC-type sulfate/molybdate transport systems ATPase subunit